MKGRRAAVTRTTRRIGASLLPPIIKFQIVASLLNPPIVTYVAGYQDQIVMMAMAAIMTSAIPIDCPPLSRELKTVPATSALSPSKAKTSVVSSLSTKRWSASCIPLLCSPFTISITVIEETVKGPTVARYRRACCTTCRLRPFMTSDSISVSRIALSTIYIVQAQRHLLPIFHCLGNNVVYEVRLIGKEPH